MSTGQKTSGTGPMPKPIPLWRVLEEEMLAMGYQHLDGYEQRRDRIVQKIECEKDPKNRAKLRAELEDLALQAKPAARGEPRAPWPRTALCLSGGGIRSAAFSLGVLTALAKKGILSRISYLSTVSGGGYAGSWLSAWMYNIRNQGCKHSPVQIVERALSEGGVEATAIANMRQYARFLSPRSGILSVDLWTVIATYLRNLILMWTVFLPVVFSFHMIPRIILSAIRSAQNMDLSFYWTQALLLLGLLCGAWALAYSILSQPSIAVRMREDAGGYNHARAGGQAWFLGACLAPLLASVVLLTAYATDGAGNAPERCVGAEAQPPSWMFIPIFASAVGVAAGAISFLLRWVTVSAAFSVREVQRLWPIVIAGTLGGGAFAGAQFAHAHVGSEWWRWIASVIAGICMGGMGALVVYCQLGWRLSKWPIVVATLSGAVVGALLSWARDLATNFLKDPSDAIWFTCGVIFVPVLVLLVLSVGGLCYIAAMSSNRTTWDDDREWWGRFGAWIAIVIVAWVVFASLVLLGPIGAAWLVEQDFKIWGPLASLGGLSGIVTLVLGSGPRTPQSDTGKSIGGRIRSTMLKVAAPCFVGVVIVGLSATTGALAVVSNERLSQRESSATNSACLALDSESAMRSLTCAISGHDCDSKAFHEEYWMRECRAALDTPLWLAVSFALGLAGIAILADRIMDSNKFSMHGLYRDRLVRAFLGVSNAGRSPDSFTGFYGPDNIQMCKLRPATLRLRDLSEDSSRSHVLIAKLRDALSLQEPVDGNGLAWSIARNLSADVRDALGALDSGKPAPRWLARSVVDDVNQLIWSRVLEDLVKQRQIDPVDLMREPHRVSGDQARENLAFLRSALKEAFKSDGHRYNQGGCPFHIINVALNLVADTDPALQDRKAESFTISSLHCGSASLGYRDSMYYGGDRGMSLGTAMTLSGAAVSPNQGYHSSPAIAFLLTLFNVRLGLWLGNPGNAGNRKYRRDGPKIGIWQPIAEALGLTNRRRAYVYLSDGGHFENLGLYEMVRRRCEVIIVVDAGADEKYSQNDLGAAIRKVRIDFGVSIEFDDEKSQGETAPKAAKKSQSRYYRRGKIVYPNGCEGTVFVLKPNRRGHVPLDVAAYRSSSESFPQESTGDQFYTEAQFESYRKLGEFAAAAMIQAEHLDSMPFSLPPGGPAGA